MRYARGRRVRRRRRRLGRVRKVRRVRRRGMRQRNSVRLGRVMPKKCTMVHRYVDIRSISMSIGPVDTIYRANDVWDPYNALGGHSASGFDQMKVFYSRWTVIGSRMRVKIMQSPSRVDPENTQPIVCCVIKSMNSTLANSSVVQYVAENPLSSSIKWVYQDRPATFTSSWSARKMMGGDVLDSSNSGYSAAGPTNRGYYHICMQGIQSATQVNYIVQVVIDYIVVWREPNDFIRSGTLTQEQAATPPPTPPEGP